VRNAQSDFDQLEESFGSRWNNKASLAVAGRDELTMPCTLTGLSVLPPTGIKESSGRFNEPGFSCFIGCDELRCDPSGDGVHFVSDMGRVLLK